MKKDPWWFVITDNSVNYTIYCMLVAIVVGASFGLLFKCLSVIIGQN